MVTVARVLTSACSFILFWFISRNSVEQLGAFRTLFIFFLLIEFFPLLGMNQYVIREIAKQPTKISNFIINAFLLSMMVSIVMSLGIVVFSLYGGYSQIVSKGLLIIITGIPAAATVLCLQSVMIASSRGCELGVIQCAEIFTRTLVGVWLVHISQNILYVIAGFIVCRWLIIPVYWKMIASHTAFGLWQFNRKHFYCFLKQCPQFACILVLFLTIRFAGQLMVSWIGGDVDAGYFAIAYQFLDLILLVPTAFTINLMPVLSRKADQSYSEFISTGRQALKLIATITIPLTLFIYINNETIILMIFGDQYRPAIVLVSISIWAGLIFSMDQIMSTSMIAAAKQSADLASLFVGAIATTGSMYYLISVYGIVGAAASVAAGTAILFLSRNVFFNSVIARINILTILWRQLISGMSMAIVMCWTNYNILISGLTGILTYIFVLILLGDFKTRERMLYLELFRN